MSQSGLPRKRATRPGTGRRWWSVTAGEMSAVVRLMVIGVLVGACGGPTALTVRLSENLLPADQAWAPVQEQGSWAFGFDQRLEPKEDVRMNASLLNLLTERTGLTFRLHSTPEQDSVVDELCGGEIDFAIVGTVSYLQANDRCGVRMLVRGVNDQGEDTYRAAIVTRNDAAFDGEEELRGLSFAFGSPNSTQGHLIPRLMLEEAGIALDDLRTYTFTSSHAETARAVTNGSFDAGGLQDTLAFELAGYGLVRILALSDPYPSSGIVAGPAVPEETVEIVRSALLGIDPVGDDSGLLYHWERSEMPRGFVPATDSDYDALRRIAREVGLLDP